jgi:hypothetical protein
VLRRAGRAETAQRLVVAAALQPDLHCGTGVPGGLRITHVHTTARRPRPPATRTGRPAERRLDRVNDVSEEELSPPLHGAAADPWMGIRGRRGLTRLTASSDDYVTRQTRTLAEAVRAEGARGVGTRSFQLAEHLAAEGGVHRGDVMVATALLLSVVAWCDGEVEAAERFARNLRRYGDDSLELVFHTLRLETGRDRGWLPRADYDALMEYVRREGRADMAARARVIVPRDLDPVPRRPPRRPEPPDGARRPPR